MSYHEYTYTITEGGYAPTDVTVYATEAEIEESDGTIAEYRARKKWREEIFGCASGWPVSIKLKSRKQ
jgi:hypothetical protein